MSNLVNDEIQELRSLLEAMRDEAQRRDAEVDALRAETIRLGELVAATPCDAIDGARRDAEEFDEQRSSRRTMFKAGAGAAVAAAAFVAGGSSDKAAAADGGNMLIGRSNSSSGDHTRLTSSGTELFTNQNILSVTDESSSSSYPAAIGAYAQGDRVTNGIYAYADSREADDTRTGHAVVARATSGARSNLLLTSGSFDPRNDSYAHGRGEMRHASGRLWFCTQSGTPGTWVDLTAPVPAAVTPIAPRRCYDSRFADGPLINGFSRTVSVASGIDVGTGADTGPLVPSGASAVLFNITVTQTTGGGFLAATPGDAASFEASSVNWSSPNQTVANGTFSSIDAARELKVFAGGGNAHFIIDVTGYLG